MKVTTHPAGDESPRPETTPDIDPGVRAFLEAVARDLVDRGVTADRLPAMALSAEAEAELAEAMRRGGGL